MEEREIVSPSGSRMKTRSAESAIANGGMAERLLPSRPCETNSPASNRRLTKVGARREMGSEATE
jgi:hypothetical protein